MTTPATCTYTTVITAIETVDRDGHLRDRPVLCTAVIPKHSKNYGLRLSVDVDRLKGYKPGDQVTITVERGKERKSPPQYPSDWYWNLWSINHGHTVEASGRPAEPEQEEINAPPWANPPPEYAQPTGQDALQSRIAWNSAVNNAVHALASNPEGLRIFAHERGLSQFLAHVMTIADGLYPIIMGGPPASVPAKAPSKAADEPPAAVPPLPPPSTPEAIAAGLVQSLVAWNHDVNAGVRDGAMLSRSFLARWVKSKHDWALDPVTLQGLTLERAVTVSAAIAKGEVN